MRHGFVLAHCCSYGCHLALDQKQNINAPSESLVPTIHLGRVDFSGKIHVGPIDKSYAFYFNCSFSIIKNGEPFVRFTWENLQGDASKCGYHVHMRRWKNREYLDAMMPSKTLRNKPAMLIREKWQEINGPLPEHIPQKLRAQSQLSERCRPLSF